MTRTPPPEPPDEGFTGLLDRLAGYLTQPSWTWSRTLQLALLLAVCACIVVVIAIVAPQAAGYIGAGAAGYAIRGGKRCGQ